MNREILPSFVLHWNYRGFTEFPIQTLKGEETEVTDIYLKENLISRIPNDIGKLIHLESLYLSGNDITELPREISNLRCLKCLDVSGNRLNKIPNEIGDAKSLKFLILDENELSELPLRIAELRSLRYLSVCDNKLKWLPQQPVYNYYHCEFRFWRNISLRIMPYSLWYHMFRDQQTRSLNIGCLSIPKYQEREARDSRCRIKISEIKITQNSREWEVDIESLPHQNISDSNCCTPPSLYELCRRNLYHIISDIAKKLSQKSPMYSYNDNYNNNYSNNITNLESSLENIIIEDNGNNQNYDLNGNNLPSNEVSNRNSEKIVPKSYYVPKDVVDEHFDFLPIFMKDELNIGPVSKCENIVCRKPVFDYAVYEFSLGKLTLIDNIQQVILSATFCSKSCAGVWKKGKKDILSWKLLQY